MNLLTEPLISVVMQSDGQRSLLSLPHALAACARDVVARWPALRPHQEPAWHMLLVQLGVLAHLAARTDRLETEEEWRSALRALTPGFPDDEPWRLVVDDWMKPAFLQPPCEKPAARADFKKGAIRHADSLDMLVTSRNHDLKTDRITGATPEEWLYALVTLQTQEGFLGAGNYGIARMNGGFASRSMLRCHPAGLGPGGQVMRDIRTLLARYDTWREEVAGRCHVGTHEDLQPLLWLLPWDGASSLSLKDFHPLAIEVCRRVRLQDTDGGIVAQTATSKQARVDAKDAKGHIGDPWAPIEQKGNKALTLSGEGFGYRRMVALLDAREYQRPLLAFPGPFDSPAPDGLIIQAAGLARGQGKTEGVHRRTVQLSPASARLFAREPESFASLAQQFTDMAGRAGRSALRPALVQLIQGKEDPDWRKPSNDPLTATWMAQYDKEVDRRFFAELDAGLASGDGTEAAQTTWSRVLHDVAFLIFDRACEGAPRGEELRMIAQARAHVLLKRGLHKQLPLLRSPQEETADEPT